MRTGHLLIATALAAVTVACTGGSTRHPPDSAYAYPVPAPGPSRSAARTKPASRPAPPRITVSGLIGTDEAALHRLLGKPQFRRSDPPARLLRYRAPDCLLDLFLYPRDGAHRVSHVEARARDGKDRAAPACLDAVLDARAAAKAG